MMKFLKGQSGFSMVQGLVLAGIIAGSSLVATRLLTDQKVAQKSSETRDLVEDLHNVVYSALQNRLHCRATMLGAGVTASLAGTASATAIITLNGVYTYQAGPPVTQTQIMAVGSIYMNQNVQLKSMRLLAASGSFRSLEITYDRMQVNSASSNLKKGVGAKEIKKYIPLRIQREPTTGNPFSGCYAVQSSKASMNSTSSLDTGNDLSKEMCQSMNTSTGTKAFIWDEANSLCMPNSKCSANQVYTGIDSTGDVKCRNLEDWMDFNQIIDPLPPTCDTGQWIGLQIDTAIKMVRVVCSGPTTRCTNRTMSWTQGLATCVAAVPTQQNGTSYTATDTAGPSTGTAVAICTAGNWTISGSCTSTCPATTINWVHSGNACSGNVAAGVAGATNFVSDTTPPLTGSANATCLPNTGTWDVAPNNCNPPKSCYQPAWGITIPHGGSVTAYFYQTRPGDCGSHTQVRVCNDGVLSGSYFYQSCTNF